MIIKWTDLAYDSFEDEIDFIINKWNKKEALKFSVLVQGFLILLEEIHI
jgi:plasmid stabilization system protein ParE